MAYAVGQNPVASPGPGAAGHTPQESPVPGATPLRPMASPGPGASLAERVFHGMKTGHFESEQTRTFAASLQRAGFNPENVAQVEAALRIMLKAAQEAAAPSRTGPSMAGREVVVVA